jgi:hypothetical protein
LFTESFVWRRNDPWNLIRIMPAEGSGLVSNEQCPRGTSAVAPAGALLYFLADLWARTLSADRPLHLAGYALFCSGRREETT